MEKKKKNPIISYFKDVKRESKKIVWPSRKNLIKYSVATLIFIAFMALFFLILSFLAAFLQGTVVPWIRTIIK
mgnify:FL=1